MPLFLFALLNLYSIMEIYETQMGIQAALHQTAKKLAVEGYAYGCIDGNGTSQSFPVQVAFSETYVRGEVNKWMTKEKLDASVIMNGAKGISYSFSKLMEKDRIELVAVYRISPRFSMIPFSNTYTFSQGKVRAFTGYDPSMDVSGSDKQEETYVYVTNTGKVYHTDRGCSYLKLSLHLVTKEELTRARNEAGGRYKACGYCKPSSENVPFFLITNHGNRYHTSVSCIGIKRTIQKIPLSKATRYDSCSRCGGY